MSRHLSAAVLCAVIALAAFPARAHAPLSCTPGFWKNHLLESHGPHPALCPSSSTTIDCFNTLGNTLSCAPQLSCPAGHTCCTCEELVFFLSAELGATEPERAAAQACLNQVAQDQLNLVIVCD